MTAATESPTAAKHHPTQPMPYLEIVDPATLIREDNSRDDVPIEERDPGLVASVEEHGVVCAVLANPTQDGRLKLVWGFGRTEAAILANRAVPVMVSQDGADSPLARLLSQMAENMHRTGYKTAELARNYQQLALLGLDPDEIARKLATPLPEIEAGLTIATKPRTHAASAAHPDLDMLTLLELAEFEDDPALHAKLIEIATTRPRHLHYELTEARQDRDAAAKVTALADQFREQGYTVVDRQLPTTTMPLSHLCGPNDLAALDPETHASCPGRAVAAWSNYSGEPVVSHVCVDYEQQGHRSREATGIQKAIAGHVAQGLRVVDGEIPDTTRRLTALTPSHDDTSSLTAEAHAQCPGHAAYVTGFSDGHATTTYVCVDFADHGHHDHYTGTSTGTQAPALTPDQQKAARKRVLANNGKWRAALVVRRRHLDLMAHWGSLPAGLTAKQINMITLTARHIARDRLGKALTRGNTYSRSLLPALDRQRTQFAKDTGMRYISRLSADKLAIADLVDTLAALEQHYDQGYTVKTWFKPSVEDRFYFWVWDFLATKLDNKTNRENELEFHTLGAMERLVLDPDADAADWPALFAPDSDAEQPTEAGGHTGVDLELETAAANGEFDDLDNEVTTGEQDPDAVAYDAFVAESGDPGDDDGDELAA